MLTRPGDVVRVRMTCNWCPPRELCELFNRMTTDGNYEWCWTAEDGVPRRLRIVADDGAADFWCVINAPWPGDEKLLDRERTVVFQMEPEMASAAMRERWGRWAAPSPLSFLQVRDHARYRNSNDWWVGRTYRELRDGPPPEKTATMAACVSAKYFDPGHVKRVDFLRFLDRQDLDLDIYGYEGHGFRRARGTTPPHDKSRALLPYRYYFDAENHATPNFFTEKIVDCILAEALCFYWGAPNLDSFLDPRSYIRLDLDDFEADLATIRAAIAGDEWSRRLPVIRAEKQRILECFQFFPTLVRALEPAILGERGEGPRCRSFVEISERTGDPRDSETLALERGLRWSGLCLEQDVERGFIARTQRDCTVAIDAGEGPVHQLLRRNGLAPNSIEWLNLATPAPSGWLAEGGRLDPALVRANAISMPLADEDERRRCLELLSGFGYEPAGGALALRRGRDQIFGFYHLGTFNDWRGIAGEQIARWREAGLVDATTRILASVVGPELEAGVELLEGELGERLEIVFASEDASFFERPILEYARRFCAEAEPLARACWYMHSKGVTSRGDSNVRDWRRFMESVVVERWRECAEALDHHDACGVNWLEEPEPHFSGNFWWASPRYLARLPETIGPVPLAPEMWIGTGQPKVLCLAESGVNHYHEAYPESAYGKGRSADDEVVPPIFCVHLESNRGRGKRMRRRLAHHGLLERSTLVPAIAIPETGEWSLEWKVQAMKACVASHIKAIRLALEDPEVQRRGAIICEDDVLLHDEFAERFAAVRRNLPEDPTLCQLGYALHHHLGELEWAGREPERENLCRLVPGMVWATHMYWVSPAYAAQLVERYGEVPLDDLEPIIEHQVTHPSGGYLSYPSLALQDLIDSTVRPPEEMHDHFVGQTGWPYDDYAGGEEGDRSSPLARLESLDRETLEAMARTRPARPSYAPAAAGGDA